jgi:hypothetical protein
MLGKSVYVLKLEDHCWYIGLSTNLEKRLKDHFDGKGAEWTKLHKPLKLEEKFIGYGENYERFITFEYMSLYGIDLVRGGAYTVRVYPEWKLKIISCILRKHYEEKTKYGFDFKLTERIGKRHLYKSLPIEEEMLNVIHGLVPVSREIDCVRYVLSLGSNQFLIEGENLYKLSNLPINVKHLTSIKLDKIFLRLSRIQE